MPDGVDLVTAAALPEVAATVYSNLIMTAQLQPGETVLIHGATGGIGTMAIQLAKAFGARVAATAGTEEKVGTAKAFLGADIAINYAEEDFPDEPARTERRQGRRRDPRRRRRQVPAAKRGGPGRLRPAGRHRAAGRRQGRNWTWGSCSRKRAAVIATALRPRPIGREGRHHERGPRRTSGRCIADGRIKPLVAKTFPLARSAAAHAYFDSGEHVGKVLLTA